MDNIFISEILAALRNLIDNTSPLNVLIMLGIFLKISSLTVFSDEVAMSVSLVHINKLDNVLVL